MKEALFYSKQGKDVVKCELCPHNCLISIGSVGICGVRRNIDGILYSLFYGKPCAVNLDPIEKKPLYHFLPGNPVLSIATVGCNLKCSFCQNWSISDAKRHVSGDFDEVSPQKIVELCKTNNCNMISFTYTEPTIFYEYMIDVANISKKENIKNIIVSNGYINEKPLRRLCKVIDGANIDLKSFDEEFYTKFCKGKLDYVLKTLKILKEEGVWFEITNLMIPDENDDMLVFENMCKWIAKDLGKEVPLHISRFHPDHKMSDKPPTDVNILKQAEEIAKKHLDYVYVGNLIRDNNTFCPECDTLLVRRDIVRVKVDNMKNGICTCCGEKIAGIWE